MSASLEPITRARLSQFRRRRQTLQVAKGLFGAAVLGLVLLGLVVAIDANIVINQPLRWCLSLAIYGVLAAWLMATALRVWRRESLPSTARAFEQLDPRLHEQLLSAVELDEDTPANRASSPSFRAVVQQQVARALAPVRVQDLLPWTLVRRAALLAVISVAIGFGLAFVPGLHWPHRVARALLPGANLGRISRFDIEIVSPEPASTLLPTGDVAAIEARVRGPLPESVRLETRIAGQRESMAMRGVARTAQASTTGSPAGSRTVRSDTSAARGRASATAVEIEPGDLVYTANLTLGEAGVDYRVIAEDAHTPWYRLTTRPRPEALGFRASVTPPPYSGLPEQQLQSESGDLEVLKGSRVRLEITADQPIEKGSLQMNLVGATTPKQLPLQPKLAPPSKVADSPSNSSSEKLAETTAEKSTVKLAEKSAGSAAGTDPSAATVWVAEFTVEDDFTYRVHFDAAETRFTNAFSPEYQVRAVVDLSPRLTWEEPKTSLLVVEPNQLLPMAVHVEDELPLAELLMLTSLNGEPAVTKKLDPPPQADATAALELDLLALESRVGDTVRVVLQGTDRLGQPTQTSPVEVIVSSTAVDPQRRPATEQRIELAGELRRFSEQLQPQLKQVRELHEAFNKTHSDQALGELRRSVDQLGQQSQTLAKELRQKVVSQLKLPQDSVSLAELERVGQVLARIESEIGPTAERAADELDPQRLGDDSEAAKDAGQTLRRDRANAARSSAEKLIESAGVLDRRFREFVAHDVLAEIARGMSVVQDFQEELAAQADAIPPAQLRRRQAIVARQLREIEQIMIDRSPLLRDAASHGMRSWIEWSGQLAERIERATADRDDNPNFKEFTRQVSTEVNDHQHAMSADSGLPGEINNGRKELDATSQTASGILSRLADLAKKRGELADESRGDDDVLRQEIAEQWQQRLDEALDQLQHRKELQQSRGDSDALLVSDLGNAIRGAKRLLESGAFSANSAQGEAAGPASVEAANQLKAAASALKKLEAIHNVNEANKHLGDLEQTERWSASSVEARTESPRAWDALQQRLEQSARALRDAGVDPQLVKEIEQLRASPTAAAAAEKISARRSSPRAAASAEAELAELHGQFERTRAKLAEVAQSVRSQLAGMAPTIPELARQAAEKTRQLEEKTKQLSKSAADDEVPDLKTRLDELSADQQRMAAPLDDLRDALTEMAATQDLLQRDQREVARDADTSQNIIDKSNEQIAQSLKPAAAAQTPAAAAEPLEKAAATQGQATEALEKIADHFEKLQAGDLAAGELADSRLALKSLASDLDMQAMEEWYKTAEMLGKLAGGDPEQVLKRLEDELARNLRMREELSDIAKQAVEESVQSLTYSAQQERSLQSQLEQSDPRFAVKKSLLQQDIQAANERMQQWMQQLTGDSAAVASRASARPQQKRLADLQQQLDQTVAVANKARDAALPLAELQSIARHVLESLQAAQEQLGAVADELTSEIDQSVHANPQELRNRKREMEDWQRRSHQQQIRGAQAIQRSHAQRHSQADTAAHNAESLLRTAERQRDELQKKASQKPDDAGLQAQLKEQERKVTRQQREVELAQDKQAEIKERWEQANRDQAEMAAHKLAELAAPNPTAELASQLSQRAAATSARIAGQLAEALNDSGWMTQLQAAARELQEGGQSQQRVEQAVDTVADNLRRAARHEQRLEHPRAAEQIDQQAERVEAAAKQQVHTATERLSSAAERTQAAAATDPSAQAPPSESLAARQAVSEAETELRQRASELQALSQQPAPQEARSTDQEPPAPASAPSVPLDPKMMARMLDELDRAMTDGGQQGEDPNQAPSQSSQDSQNGQPTDDNNQNSSQQNSGDGKQSAAQMASMQEAAQQLAQQMNQQRAQGRQSTAASRMSSNSADTKPAPPSAVRVLDVDRRSSDDWGKLREQSAEDTVESSRQTVAPQYRQSVETYFRVLSERGHRSVQP